MRWIKLAIGVYIALVLQAGILQILLPDMLRFSALVIVANIVLLSWPSRYALLAVWIIGLLGDMTSISPPGAQAMCFLIYGLIVTAAKPVLFIESPLAHGLTAGLGMLVIQLSYSLLAFLIPQVYPLSYSPAEILSQSISTGIVAWLLAQFLFRPKTRYQPIRHV